MKFRSNLYLILIFMVAGCSPDNDISVQTDYQAVSALGDTLYAPKLAPDTESRFETNLKEARTNYLADPDDAEALIWYGRRTAYLGNYRKAIAIYTRGIEKHSRDARFYRHRGHRYITLRKFQQAIDDLKKATQIIEGTEDRMEPDGLPNAQNKPRSTLHTNIWYHLGLAHYLARNFDSAVTAYRNCLEASTNDDMLTAASYWLYMALRRTGKDNLAGDVLSPIEEEMEIIENDSYHKLLLVFKGNFDEKSLLSNDNTSLEDATLGYGLGNWHYINGREEKAYQLWENVYNGTNWPAFGYIASEVELAERK